MSAKIKKAISYQLSAISILFTLVIDGFAAEPPRYKIEAKIDTANHKIIAQQAVVFTNNSDQQLKELYFHIYPHRKYTEKEIRFLYRYAGYFKVNPFPEGFQSGDLKIEAISSQGKALTYIIEGEDQTILKVNLDSSLLPGESQEINMNFSVQIPHAYGKFGWHQDIITLARWYPILNVFDKDGWHNYPFYIFHQPYFSDASYYQVKLTLPKKYGVASTGYLKEEIANADGTKTLNIETDSLVRDFALGLSDNFMVYSIKEDKFKINAYHLKGDEAKAKEAAHFALETMRFYSQRFGEYPYLEFNIVPSYLGYGGCQSSNLIFIDTRVYKLPGFLERYFDFLIAHETGHQWFYNLIGSDEYREMFLDEGMNSYWLLQYLENKYGPDAKVMVLPKSLRWIMPNFSFRSSTAARYIYMAKNGLDQPIIGELSSFQEPSSIFAITYGKGAGVLEMLEAVIGKDKLAKIMQRYTSEFRFRNIKLEDFIKICNEESGQDLSAFFAQWLKTKKTVDFAIKSVTKEEIVLENRGQIQMPVRTKIVYADGQEKIDSWDGSTPTKVIAVERDKAVKKIEVDPDNSIVLDLDRTNNYWPKELYIKPVPLYFFAYEIPVFLPRKSYNLVLGPSVGSSSLGIASSLQKPDDNILRLGLDYDFDGKALESTLGYEFSHLFNKQTALGFEIFDYESSKEKNDLSGGKIYLRRELWPASYGLFDLNDHVTFYLLRDRRLDKASSGLSGAEDIQNNYYRKKDEAIFGITGSLGRYGPYPDPDAGFKFIPTQEFAGHFLGGNESFWRTTLELDNYHLVLPKYQHKLASRIKIGWGEASDKKLFQLGGPDGLRGYSRKTVEGAHMILGGLEYRLPLKSDLRFYLLDNILHLDKIQAVGFFDVGKAWFSDFQGNDFKKDVGLGLRFHFDLLGFLEKAVLRIDVAQALHEPKEHPHIWLGLSQVF
jgi:hypothetical protein